MNWFQLALLILQLLKQFKGSANSEQFVENMQSSGIPLANGDLLRWLWENREKIAEIIKMIIGMIPASPPATTLSEDDVLAEIKALLAE
jgi:hypothetical protein